MQRLVGGIARDWVLFDGWAASHLAGSDPLDMPIDRFLNLTYYYFVRQADEDQKTTFDSRLWMPPKGVEPPPGSFWSAEHETEALHAFAAQVQGAPVPVTGAVNQRPASPS